MATCSLCNDGKRLTAHGLKIHLGKVHGVHHGDSEKTNTQMPSGLLPCPHPFCKKSFPADQMRQHWEDEHETWKLHDGRFVWEVLDEKAVEAVEKTPRKESEQVEQP